MITKEALSPELLLGAATKARKLLTKGGLSSKRIVDKIVREGKPVKFDLAAKKLKTHIAQQEIRFVQGAGIRQLQLSATMGTKSHAELMRLQAKAQLVPGMPLKLTRSSDISSDLVPRADTVSVMRANRTRGYPMSSESKYFRVKKYTDRD